MTWSDAEGSRMARGPASGSAAEPVPSRPRISRRPGPGSGYARAPKPVPPSVWMLPDAAEADEHGVVGLGADLTPATLVDAYRRGIFPWPHPGLALPWFSPDPRGVIFVDEVHLPRRLRTRLRTSGWTATVDEAFAEVVEGCAQRPPTTGTWITQELSQAYARLHQLGWAHSVEIWEGTDLVGGLFGIQVGGVFTGESMFHRRSDASKAALVETVARLAEAGAALLDVQLVTPHLQSLGAVELPRDRFLELLTEHRDRICRLPTVRGRVDRLTSTQTDGPQAGT